MIISSVREQIYIDERDPVACQYGRLRDLFKLLLKKHKKEGAYHVALWDKPTRMMTTMIAFVINPSNIAICPTQQAPGGVLRQAEG